MKIRLYDLFDFLFPISCPVCFMPVMPKGQKIHEKCIKKLDIIKEPYCLKCGRNITDSQKEMCPDCMRKTFDFDSGRCTFNYRSSVNRAIKSIKENGTEEFVEFMADIMVRCHKMFLENIHPEILVPVPIYYKKENRRGFNQSKLLADAVSGRTGIPVQNALIKIRNTADQKELGKRERESNLLGAFRTDFGDNMIPESVLLIDDIFTTGSTLSVCAKELKKSGVRYVYFLALAAGDIST